MKFTPDQESGRRRQRPGCRTRYYKQSPRPPRVAPPDVLQVPTDRRQASHLQLYQTVMTLYEKSSVLQSDTEKYIFKAEGHPVTITLHKLLPHGTTYLSSIPLSAPPSLYSIWEGYNLFSITRKYDLLSRELLPERHCLNHLYAVNTKPAGMGAMRLRQTGHDFSLPTIQYEFINERYFIARSLFSHV